MIKPEILSPAGDMEKLRYAVAYGADAVYFSGNQFGMRTAAGNFMCRSGRSGKDTFWFMLMTGI